MVLYKFLISSWHLTAQAIGYPSASGAGHELQQR
jgi:hypothetical protein